MEAERDIRALGVQRLSLFGSVVRDQARLDSDVDLLVEFFPGAKTYRHFLALAELLEERLGRRVELVTRKHYHRFSGRVSCRKQKMCSEPRDYLLHILAEVDYLIGQSAGLTVDDFLVDETRQRAFVRSLEIIGEATKKIPDSFRARFADIEWRAMAGMRDRSAMIISVSITSLCGM
jgi:uncharacterized protein with HEPN domain/predicted nucleotidyltransferase